MKVMMRSKQGFALVQVMLFSMLIAAFIYSMTIVQRSASSQSASEQQAAQIAPAIYSIVNSAILQEEDSGDDNLTGDEYYEDNDPLSIEYEQVLNDAGYDVSGVVVTITDL
jgi:type II secretory pathway component PulK